MSVFKIRKRPSFDLADFKISSLSLSLGMYSFVELTEEELTKLSEMEDGIVVDVDDEDDDDVEWLGFRVAIPYPFCTILLGSSDFFLVLVMVIQ